MKVLFILIFIFISSVSYADMIIGSETVYHIVNGDTIELISAKLGVNQKNIIKDNNIDLKKHLKIGQELRVNTRKIVPEIIDDGIIINIPDKMLYFFRKGKLEMCFPVGLGMPTWKTATGKFKVLRKEKNPTWYVPKSIQHEMEMKQETVKVIVPPGPDNPLGRYAIKISILGILIHETIWPNTVYQFRSHGCIRVMPENIEKFFKDVEINTSGEIIYSPVKVAVSGRGRVFFEVHKDVYRKVEDLNAEAKELIGKAGVADRVNWQKVDVILKEKAGIAEDITL